MEFDVLQGKLEYCGHRFLVQFFKAIRNILSSEYYGSSKNQITAFFLEIEDIFLVLILHLTHKL